MCNPLALGIVGALGSVASTGMSMMMQNKAVKDQNALNAQWRQWQQQQRQEENVRQEGLRQQAANSRETGLEDLTAPKQQQAQTDEQERLNTELVDNTDLNAPVSDKLLSGQQAGGEVFQTDVARRINTASQEARKRIAALATMQSYGGSFGGLQNRNQEVFANTDQGINLANNQRQGSMAAYQIAKGVNPPQMGATSDPFSGIGGALAKIAGTGLGSSFGKA